MRHVARNALVLSFSCALTASAESASSRAVELKASDGTKLAATYFSAGKEPAPGILLLHQCNRDRTSWNNLALRLAERGFHVLTLDYRGYGESGGTPYTQLTFPQQRQVGQKWPGDVDVAYAYLRAQPGVRSDIAGAGGASCGVNQSIQLARRHPEVKSLVLLSGFTNADGRKFLKASRAVPLLLASADDDTGVPVQMAWLDASSGNAANQFIEYAAGGHGTVMFEAHPDLQGDIVEWYQATLLGKKAPAPASARKRPDNPAIRLLVLLDEPGGPARVADELANERKKNPASPLLAAGSVNQLGYAAVEAGDTKAGVRIMQINVENRPASSNAWDSLGDALLADGQNAKAREAAQKALSLVDADTAESKDQKDLIRQSAQQKLAPPTDAKAPQ